MITSIFWIMLFSISSVVVVLVLVSLSSGQLAGIMPCRNLFHADRMPATSEESRSSSCARSHNGSSDLNGVSRLSRPQTVVREHASNAFRWAPGERLNHLLEEACIRFATNDAVIGSGIVLSYRDLNRRANQTRASSARTRNQVRRPRRNDVRQIARNIRGDACGDESQCGLCATRRRLSA